MIDDNDAILIRDVCENPRSFISGDRWYKVISTLFVSIENKGDKSGEYTENIIRYADNEWIKIKLRNSLRKYLSQKIEGKIIYHWVVPDNVRDYTGFDDIPDQYRIIEDERAASGIIIEAKYNGKWMKNPWSTRLLVHHLIEVIRLFMEKRRCDGLNGRMWNGLKHCDAEEKIEKVMREFTESDDSE